MRVINIRNVHEALPVALAFLDQCGEKRESRNGPVLVAPWPVTTVYEKPCERVVFWPSRDANPFFHLYESLWMLAGRNDVKPLCRYVARSIDYSDDGYTLHGAYGYRWRNWFSHGIKDQLRIIATRLKEDATDRRSILQMWDCLNDLWTNEEIKHERPRIGKDFPCNVIATFQRGSAGELNLTVFCRSNDIIWGAYGANAVQFSMLLEYMALWIGCPVGTYTQISVNWHAYLDTFEKVKDIRPDRVNFVENPYIDRRVHSVPLIGDIGFVDQLIHHILRDADDIAMSSHFSHVPDVPWARTAYLVLKAHSVYKNNLQNDRYEEALRVLAEGDPQADWIVAAREWLQRRYNKRMGQLLGGELSHP